MKRPHEYAARHRNSDYQRRYPLVHRTLSTCALLAAVLAPQANAFHTYTVESEKQSDIVEYNLLQASGVPAHVVCAPLPFSLLGFTKLGDPLAPVYLDSSVCDKISDPSTPPLMRAMGFLVIGHELAHQDGVKNEINASCDGFATMKMRLKEHGWPEKRLNNAINELNSLVPPDYVIDDSCVTNKVLAHK